MKTTHFRRFFLTIISVLMVGVFSCICVSADELDTAEPIKLDQEKSITAYKDYGNIQWSHYYKFTAPYTGLFEIATTPFESNSISVTDLEGHYICGSDYNPYTKKVDSVADLIKGRVYYIEIQGYEDYSEHSQIAIRTSIKKHSHRLGSYTYIYSDDNDTGLFYRECLCNNCGYKNLFFKNRPSISKLTKGKKKFTARIRYKYDVQFQLQYSTNKNFKKAKSTTLFVYESKTIKKLRKKKTYYVRVRAYTTANNGISNVKVYSPWSAVKKVKTK